MIDSERGTHPSRAQALALLGVAAAGTALPAHARAADTPTVHVAANANDSYGEAVYANDQGFFAKGGLNVDLLLTGSGSTITTDVISGAADVGISTVIPIALAHLKNIPLAYFCGGGLYNPNGSAALCVRADGPIQTAKDLNGQTVANTSLDDANTLAIRAWVDQHGGDSTTLQFVELAFSQMVPALKRGTVAAAPVVEPAMTIARLDPSIRFLAPHLYEVFGKNFLVSGWFARTDWLGANMSTAHRFAEIIYETGRWANAHHDESAAILVKVGKLDPALAHEMTRATYSDTITPALLQSQLDLAYKYKILDRPISAADLIVRV